MENYIYRVREVEIYECGGIEVEVDVEVRRLHGRNRVDSTRMGSGVARFHRIPTDPADVTASTTMHSFPVSTT